MSGAFDDAAGYEAYVGRWSRLAGPLFLRWLNVPDGKTWLDLGAGTGILTRAILDHAAPRRVVAIDPAAGFIELARQHIQDERAEFIVGDSSILTANAAEYDAAVAGLVLNFVPSPPDVLHSMAQAVKPGGIVAAYVWDYGGKAAMMRHFWDAAISLDPAAAEFDAGRHPMSKADNLRALFEDEGLHAVDVTALDVDAHFTDFDDFWRPFLAAQGSISKYLRALDEPAVSRLSERIYQRLPFNADGSIDMILRAWAVKGIR
jgi:2-polyprenyl-3-methyl-5-hydroxy-6-metoxy-1,4-benzoquinol methylase